MERHAACLLFLLPGILAGPLPRSTCASECLLPMNPKFSYEVEKAYVYNFQTTTETAITGTSKDVAIVTLSGVATVNVLNPCDFSLQISKTKVRASNEKVDAGPLEKQPLLFSFRDGTIEKVCPNDEEVTWALNIKKAVLSLLQHTPDSLKFADSTIETDVAGRCPTNYTIIEKGAILKKRDLTLCSGRLGRFSAVPTVSYSASAQTQTVPIFRANSECRMLVNKGVVESSQCIETHLLRPLSSVAGGGAQTKAVASISLQSTKKASSFKAENLNEESLLFDSSLPDLGSADRDLVYGLAKDICKALTSDQGELIPGLFSHLVHAVRRCSVRDLRWAYDKLVAKKSCPQVEKAVSIFLDSLPNAGTPGAVTLMALLINEGKISEARQRTWFVHLHFTKYPAKEALKSLYVIIDKPQPLTQALIGVSGYARKVCESLGSECATDPEIQVFTVKMSKHLGNKCRAKDVIEEKKILATLKALGNIGGAHKDVQNTIRDCIQDPSLPVQTRLAALQAVRSRACETSDLLLSILANSNENVEIRIASYLGAVKCPTYSTMKKIQEVLQNERINQVGSFIQSHLDNLKSSSSPGKEEIRKMARSVSHGRSFPFDFRKFSRNLEFDYFCTENNAGWDADLNIIYSPESYLPRSASMNFTLDLFGQSMNLFEIGGRFEGLEYLIESYFGPEGIYRANEVLPTAQERFGNLNEKFWSRFNSLLRPKRAAPVNKAEIEALGKVMNLDKTFYNPPKGDFFLRLFGAEVATYSYRRGLDAPDADIIFDQIFRVLGNLIDGAKNQQVEIARSVMFLDRISTFPTIAGLPLRLALNGTASLALDFESQIDVKAILRDPKTASLGLTIIPMASTEISASMGVEVNNLRYGVKTILNLHSSRGGGMKASWHQGKSFEFKLDLPKTKMSLVDAKSSLYVFSQNIDDGSEKLQKMNILNSVEYKRGGCVESASSLLGLRYCRQYAMLVPPAPTAVGAIKDITPVFPLSGHFDGSIYIEKTEPSMTGIHVIAKGSNNGGKTSFEIIFDTPGSQTDRKIVFTGIGFNTQSRYGIEGKAQLSGKSYEAKVYTDMAQSSSRLTVSPVIEYTLPNGKKDVLVTGRVVIEEGKKITFEVAPSGSWKKLELGASGSAEFDFSNAVRKVVFKDVKVTTPLGNSGFSAVYSRDHHSVDSGLELIYGQNNRVGFVGKVTDKSVQSVKEYATEVGFKSTRFPFLSFSLNWDFKKTPENLENGLNFVFGQDSEAKKNQIYLKQYRKRRGSFATKDLVIENKIDVRYPGSDFEFKVDQSLNYYPQKLDGRFKIEFGGKNILNADLIANIKRDMRTLYDAKIKVEYPGRRIEIYDNVQQVSEHIYKSVSSLELKPGPKYDLISLLTYDNRRDHLKFEIDADVKPNYASKPYKLKTYLLLKDKYAFVTKNKFEGDGGVKFLLDGRFDPTAVEPELAIETNIFGRAEGKLSGKLGKSDKTFEVGVFIPKYNRKITATSLARTGGEFKRLEAAIAWDALNDKSKQISLEVSARIPPSEIATDLRAGLNVIGSKYNAHLAGTLGRGFYADHTARFELEFPGAKKVVLGLRSSNSKSNDRTNLKGALEATLPNGEEYRFETDNRLTDVDSRKLTFTAQSDIKFFTPAFRDGLFHIDLGRKIDTTGSRTTIGRFTFSAPRLGHNIDGNLNLLVSSDSYKLAATGQRGPSFISLDSEGKLTLLGNKANINGLIHVKAPRMDWKEVKLTLISSNEMEKGKFEFSEKINIFYAGNTNMAAEAKASNKEALEAMLSLDTPFEGYRRQSLSARYKGIPNKHDASIVVQWNPVSSRQPAEIKTDILFEETTDSLLFKALANTPFKDFDQVEFRIDSRASNSKKTYDVDVRAGLSTAKNLKLTGKFDLQDKAKVIDVSLTASNLEPYRFYTTLVQGAEYKFESRVDFNGSYISTSAAGKFTSLDIFDFKGMVDSPALNVNKYEMVFYNRVEKRKQNTVEFSVKKAADVFALLRMTYDRKESRNNLKYKGKLDIDLKKLLNLAGAANFVYEDRKKEEFLLSAELSGDLARVPSRVRKVEYVLKNTIKERSFSRSSCEKRDCLEHVIYFKNLSGKRDENYEFAMTVKRRENRKDATSGLQVRFKNGDYFEKAVEFYFNKEASKLIGFKVYGSESERGVELYTSRRLMAANVVRESKSRVFSSSVKQKVIYSIWLDKKSKPDRKLSVYFSSEPNKLDDMDGYNWKVSIRHPAMKDFDVIGEVHYNGKNRLYHGKVDMDVLSTVHKRWVLEGNIYRDNIKQGANYTYDLTLQSQGKDLSWKVDGYKTVTPAGRLGTTLITLKDGNNENVLLTKYEITDKSFAFKVGRLERQMGLGAQWNNVGSVQDPRYTFEASTAVLGLAPTIYSFEISPYQRFQTQIYNNATPENYILAFAGLQDDQTFDLSLQHNKVGHRNDILLTRVALAAPSLLRTTQHWDMEKAKALVNTIRNRRLAVTEDFQKRTGILSQELKTFGKQWAAFDTLSTVSDKVLADYKGQTADFKKDLEKDESIAEATRIIRQGYTLGAQYTGAVTSTAEDLTIKIEKTLEETKKKIINFVNSLPQLINRTIMDLTEAFEAVVVASRNALGSVLTGSVDLFNTASNKIEESTGIISKLRNAYVTVSGQLGELFQGLQKFVNDKVERIVQYASENVPAGADRQRVTENLKRFIQIISDTQKRREAIYKFLETNIFGPWDAWRADFTKKYPEFLRPIYRLDSRTVSIVRAKLRSFVASSSSNETVSVSSMIRNRLRSMGFEMIRFDPEHGAIEFMVPLPRGVSSLREIDEAFAFFDLSKGSSRFSPLRDIFKKGELIPPFAGYAAIIGSQGYVTFDGKVYDFTSNCQYLLAKDFVDGNFTLSISYDDMNRDGVPQKSLFVSDSNDVLEITKDYKLIANGETLPAPFSLKFLNVKKEGDILEVYRTHSGYNLRCDTKRDVCVINVSGFYFGKIFGLLGSFNHEVADDWSSINKKDSKNVIDFSNNWKLNKQCKEKPVTAIATSLNLQNSQIGRDCQSLFASIRSPFRSCFGAHDPAPYLSLCEKAVARVRSTQDVQRNVLCSIAAGYKEVCKEEGYPFSLPNMCPAF
ncbi:apolipophorins-like isoform X1 [Artemia franciscana]|uniref:apolipophorins-like isoform X1 n=1 Tax=Artemia franciscana TaxID=6661 RepID=UPI0032DBAB14